MEQPTHPITDQVTVLVFKDDFQSRTFQLSHRWIRSFGLITGLSFLLTILSLLAALKYYTLSTKMDASYIQNLQEQVQNLEEQLKNGDKKKTDLPPLESVVATSNPTSEGKISMSLFSTQVSQLPAAEISNLPFSVQAQKAVWSSSSENKKRVLKVHFAIQYQKNDQGHQQGRILILARGPSTLLTYPSGAILPSGSENLLSFEKGEFFSVSRYREVNAEFGPVSSKDTLETIEIFLLSKEGKVLYFETIPLAVSPVPSTPSPKTSDHPEEETTQ